MNNLMTVRKIVHDRAGKLCILGLANCALQGWQIPI
jgi:hypothetical protein